MSKPVFKVGDRVAVYGKNQSFSNEVPLGRKTGTIATSNDMRTTDGSEYVNITLDGETFNRTFHPKQCRRLVKKARRRVWINEYPSGLSSSHYTSQRDADVNSVASRIGCIEFVEARKK